MKFIAITTSIALWGQPFKKKRKFVYLLSGFYLCWFMYRLLSILKAVVNFFFKLPCCDILYCPKARFHLRNFVWILQLCLKGESAWAWSRRHLKYIFLYIANSIPIVAETVFGNKFNDFGEMTCEEKKIQMRFKL